MWGGPLVTVPGGVSHKACPPVSGPQSRPSKIKATVPKTKASPFLIPSQWEDLFHTQLVVKGSRSANNLWQNEGDATATLYPSLPHLWACRPQLLCQRPISFHLAPSSNPARGKCEDTLSPVALGLKKGFQIRVTLPGENLEFTARLLRRF